MPFGFEPLHRFRRTVKRVHVWDRGIKDFMAVPANEVIVIFEPAVVMVRPVGYGKAANCPFFGQKIQIPIDRAAADLRIGLSGELIDFVGGRVIVVFSHEVYDQFPLPCVSVFHTVPVYDAIMNSVFKIVNNRTCYRLVFSGNGPNRHGCLPESFFKRTAWRIIFRFCHID